MEDAIEKEKEELGDWAYGIPSRKARLIKEYSSQVQGYDVNKVLTGHVLERITTDDAGAFGTAMLYFDWKVGRPEEAVKQKNIVFRRFDWEIDQAETPEVIKKFITGVKDRLTAIEFSSAEKVGKAREIWEEGVLKKVNGFISQDEHGLGSALAQFRGFEEEARKRKLNF